MNTRGRSILLGVALVLMGAATGAFVDAMVHTTSSTSQAPAVPNPTAARDARLLGLLVQGEMLSDASFPVEPNSETQAAGRVTRVYAQISRVTSQAITFDVQQYFTGDAAHREAAKDGNDDVSLESYSRNQLVRPETLSVAAESAVFLQASDGLQEGYGPAWAHHGQVVTFPEFVKRVHADAMLLDASYWITVGADGVLGIEQVFAP